jgi:bis(5'-nucleosyl)-tetraphosphatase (symmetrical)
MAHYYIGDVQGCYDPLQRLLKKIRFDPASDRLIFCGDLVSRGGHSLEVLRLLYSIRKRVTVTLGNHDFNLLREDARFPSGMTRNGEFRQILQAPDRVELMDWLAGQPLAHLNRKRGLLTLHAGVIPQWTLEETLTNAADVESVLRSPRRAKFLIKLFKDRRRIWRDELKGMKRLAMITHILTRIRYCNHVGKLIYSATGPPGTEPPGFLPWFKHPHRATRDVKIVFGHWASLGLCVKKRYVALDSGCVWGGKLSAWRAQDGELFQALYFPKKSDWKSKNKKRKRAGKKESPETKSQASKSTIKESKNRKPRKKNSKTNKSKNKKSLG